MPRGLLAKLTGKKDKSGNKESASMAPVASSNNTSNIRIVSPVVSTSPTPTPATSANTGLSAEEQKQLQAAMDFLYENKGRKGATDEIKQIHREIKQEVDAEMARHRAKENEEILKAPAMAAIVQDLQNKPAKQNGSAEQKVKVKSVTSTPAPLPAPEKPLNKVPSDSDTSIGSSSGSSDSPYSASSSFAEKEQPETQKYVEYGQECLKKAKEELAAGREQGEVFFNNVVNAFKCANYVLDYDKNNQGAKKLGDDTNKLNLPENLVDKIFDEVENDTKVALPSERKKLKVIIEPRGQAGLQTASRY